MSDQNGWPDPERPGVPENPERDGWHWLTDDGARTLAVMWVAEIGAWVDGAAHSPQGVVDLEYRYGGPCLTPAEIAAREAAAAERAWKAGYFNACGCFIGDSEDDALIAAKHAWEINKGEMCAPDALARVRAEAMREGMERAASRLETWPVDDERAIAEECAAAIRAMAQEIKP